MNIINATNKDDGSIMVMYQGEKRDGSGHSQFVRELNEFLEKFTPVECSDKKQLVYDKIYKMTQYDVITWRVVYLNICAIASSQRSEPVEQFRTVIYKNTDRQTEMHITKHNGIYALILDKIDVCDVPDDFISMVTAQIERNEYNCKLQQLDKFLED
jgi:hypothetical protein